MISSLLSMLKDGNDKASRTEHTLLCVLLNPSHDFSPCLPCWRDKCVEDGVFTISTKLLLPHLEFTSQTTSFEQPKAACLCFACSLSYAA